MWDAGEDLQSKICRGGGAGWNLHDEISSAEAAGHDHWSMINGAVLWMRIYVIVSVGWRFGDLFVGIGMAVFSERDMKSSWGGIYRYTVRFAVRHWSSWDLLDVFPGLIYVMKYAIRSTNQRILSLWHGKWDTVEPRYKGPPQKRVNLIIRSIHAPSSNSVNLI